MPETNPTTQSAEPTYALTLEGNGVTVRRDIPESVARTITALVMGGATVSSDGQIGAPAGPASGTPPAPTASKQSIREYLNAVGPKRNADTITAIAAYLKEQGLETFTRDQVKEYFRKAGEPIPGNYNRDFTDALSTGWIAEDHTNSGNYYITASGENALKNSFPGKIRRPAKKKARKANGGDES
ncbi:MAG: hypothetical protein ACYC33_08150 [Thermoleophilia bacterium]